MTDEAKPMLEDVFAPWRAWDEYTRLMMEAQELVIDGIDHGNLDWKYERPDYTRIAPNIDALCARVWREAQEVMPSRMRELAEEREAERVRADAAEARADRLAAVLRSMPCQFTRRTDPTCTTLPADERKHAPICDRCAALADVPEVVREVLDDPEAMADAGVLP